MPAVPPAVTLALHALEQAVAPPRPGTPVGNWRWAVRQRLSGLRDALAADATVTDNAWLAARHGAAFRERRSLLSRMTTLCADVLDRPDLDVLRSDLRRLVADVSHHMQRLNDLVYDDVELELGGEQ
jgi:hypothetical protein